MKTYVLSSNGFCSPEIKMDGNEMFSMLGSVVHLEIPVNQVEEEGHQGDEVDEDETDEDPLGDSDQIVHCAGLQCQLGI